MHAEDLIVNPSIAFRFENGNWTLDISDVGARFDVSHETMEVIAAFSSPASERFTRPPLSRYTSSSLEAAVEQLAAKKILVSPTQVHPMVAEWSKWTPAAWHMHLASRDVQFAITDEEQLAIAKKISSTPAPPRYKCSCSNGARISLAPPSPLGDGGLTSVLMNRRTCRLFHPAKEISFDDLSNLLFYTGGVVFENDTDHFGRVAKKCAPSPGARHSIELYPVIRRCERVPEGTYHYCSLHHAVNLISSGDKKHFLGVAMQQQEYFSNAAVACFLTSVTSRLRWKYGGPRIYRLIHFEAAHYCHNFLLTGTARSLGVFSTGALNEPEIERELGIDGVDEVVMYLAGAGVMNQVAPYIRAGSVDVIRQPEGVSARLPSDDAAWLASNGTAG
jgi:SagB-type dehydrogenase family enzyme